MWKEVSKVKLAVIKVKQSVNKLKRSVSKVKELLIIQKELIAEIYFRLLLLPIFSILKSHVMSINSILLRRQLK